MEKSAEEILKSHPLSNIPKQKMTDAEEHKWILDSMEEYAKNQVEKALKPWNEFMNKLQEEVYKDGGTDDVGEFVMDHFDLWL